MNILRKKSFNVDRILNKMTNDIKLLFATSDMDLDYIKTEQKKFYITISISFFDEMGIHKGLYNCYKFGELELLNDPENYYVEMCEIWEAIKNG